MVGVGKRRDVVGAGEKGIGEEEREREGDEN